MCRMLEMRIGSQAVAIEWQEVQKASVEVSAIDLDAGDDHAGADDAADDQQQQYPRPIAARAKPPPWLIAR